MSLLQDNNYQNILTNLKDMIRSARQRAVLKVNTELLSVYGEVGNAILVSNWKLRFPLIHFAGEAVAHLPARTPKASPVLETH